MKQNEFEDADEIYVLLGKVITQILKPGEELSIQEIIGALYRAGLRSDKPEIQQKELQLLAAGKFRIPLVYGISESMFRAHPPFVILPSTSSSLFPLFT